MELVTRIAVVPLGSGEGILREALTSLHQLFGVTREILRMAKWHPALQQWESIRGDGISVLDHESGWEQTSEFRRELGELQKLLLNYAEILAEVCGAPALIDATREILHATQPSTS